MMCALSPKFLLLSTFCASVGATALLGNAASLRGEGRARFLVHESGVGEAKERESDVAGDRAIVTPHKI